MRALSDNDWQLVALGDMPLDTLVEVRRNEVKGTFIARCLALNPACQPCGDEPGFFSQWADEQSAPIERPFQWRWRP